MLNQPLLLPKILLLTAASLWALPSLASPIIFTYNCSTKGTLGQGTNNCEAGSAVAQVRIAETDVEGVLSIAATSLLGPNPADSTPVTYQLQDLFLNYAGTLLEDTDGWDVNYQAGLFADLQIQDNNPNGPSRQDVTFIEFSKLAGFNDIEKITVLDDATDADSYKGFDLNLKVGGNQQGQPGIDLRYEAILDTFVSGDIFGYLRSGNNFNLTTDLFWAFTEDAAGNNGNNFDEIISSGTGCLEAPGHLLSAVEITPAASGILDTECGTGSYGPHYGAIEGSTSVPEPGSLALFAAGIIGLGISRRRSKKS